MTLSMLNGFNNFLVRNGEETQCRQVSIDESGPRLFAPVGVGLFYIPYTMRHTVLLSVSNSRGSREYDNTLIRNICDTHSGYGFQYVKMGNIQKRFIRLWHVDKAPCMKLIAYQDTQASKLQVEALTMAKPPHLPILDRHDRGNSQPNYPRCIQVSLCLRCISFSNLTPFVCSVFRLSLFLSLSRSCWSCSQFDLLWQHFDWDTQHGHKRQPPHQSYKLRYEQISYRKFVQQYTLALPCVPDADHKRGSQIYNRDVSSKLR